MIKTGSEYKFKDLRKNIYEIDKMIEILKQAKKAGRTHIQFFERDGYRICGAVFNCESLNEFVVFGEED